ncbi:YwqG family protein [Priestia megaterium]|uniref:YwqG family protein n=1 Tax=Priestia megaterium TaxID=1404 RepID=UPI002E1F26DE|nr:YwqG family protein [Priestia megaterium]
MTNIKIKIPEELEKYRADIEKTVVPYIKIETLKADTKLYNSKFGGYPYLPIGAEHPLDLYGNPMLLLAQINYEEMPHLDDMPTKGMLQFFITATSDKDDVYGVDFEEPTNQENFRVVYHKEVITDESKLITNFGYLKDMNYDYGEFPVPEEMSLVFKQDYEPVPTADYRFEYGFNEENDDKLFDIYVDELDVDGHKVGGYAYFTQDDPRGHIEELKEYEVLLLQIDSGGEDEIMFGDMGIANFFIKPSDLKNLNFKNVMYTWDCC